MILKLETPENCICFGQRTEPVWEYLEYMHLRNKLFKLKLLQQIKVLESEKAELESRVKELSEASTANNTVINSPATQPETSKDNVIEKTGNKDFLELFDK